MQHVAILCLIILIHFASCQYQVRNAAKEGNLNDLLEDIADIPEGARSREMRLALKKKEKKIEVEGYMKDHPNWFVQICGFTISIQFVVRVMWRIAAVVGRFAIIGLIWVVCTLQIHQAHAILLLVVNI